MLISKYSTRENWIELSGRHSLVSDRDINLHRQMFNISRQILDHRNIQDESTYRIGIGGRKKGYEVEAWWSVGTWSQKGAIYLFLDCQANDHRLTIYCVAESAKQQIFLDADFKLGKRGGDRNGLLTMKKRVEIDLSQHTSTARGFWLSHEISCGRRLCHYIAN